MYGSGIISSHGECSNLLGGGCEVQEFDLEKVLNTPVKVDRIHHLLFAIESFGQLYEAMREAEKRVLSYS
jgi:phenylalanine-4-hydroxylase